MVVSHLKILPLQPKKSKIQEITIDDLWLIREGVPRCKSNGIIILKGFSRFGTPSYIILK